MTYIKHIIVMLEAEAEKLRKEISDPVTRAAAMNGFYRAIGIVRRFEKKTGKEEGVKLSERGRQAGGDCKEEE